MLMLNDDKPECYTKLQHVTLVASIQMGGIQGFLLTIKAFNALAPNIYFREMLSLYEPTRSLCCSRQNLLHVPKSNEILYGSQSCLCC